MNDLQNEIITRYPNIQKKINQPSFDLREAREITLYNLIQFINEPEQYQFQLNELYHYLDGEDLVFALKIITQYFENKTYLLKDHRHELMKELLNDVDLLNQSNLSRYLIDKGYKLGKNGKIIVNTYYRRGNLPEPDLFIHDKPVWFKETIEEHLKTGAFKHFKEK